MGLYAWRVDKYCLFLSNPQLKPWGSASAWWDSSVSLCATVSPHLYILSHICMSTVLRATLAATLLTSGVEWLETQIAPYPQINQYAFNANSIWSAQVIKMTVNSSVYWPYLSDLLHMYIPSRSLHSSADTRTFWIPKQKKKFQGQCTFPVWALSHGKNSHILYTVTTLQQNPSSEFNSKPHYSSQPLDQTHIFLLFLLPIIKSPSPAHLTPISCRPDCIDVCMLQVCLCVCVCVCVFVLGSKWMCILLNFVL